ncbi:MAG TPA: LptA/OstA family protein, partial [Pyrinomonadaceae bacterium]|nr:LptA/OstA family protein [Pyrinomonadaceae bacterium]
WQNDNFVRADRLTLRNESKSMLGEGHVESALYQARRRQPDGTRAIVPVFAASSRMSYSDTERLLRFDQGADIKQGADRITSEAAEVYLLKDTNEVEKTVAQQNVVVTQPGRRGTGEWGQYTAADETLVLKGEPARVEDAAQGTSESRRLTVFMREGRVVSDDATNNGQSTGRIRSTHRVRKL